MKSSSTHTANLGCLWCISPAPQSPSPKLETTRSLKNSEKRALFSIKCSRGGLSIVDKIENWKNTKRKKTTSVDEKEKDEVKLHAALVLNITFWPIYEPRRDT